MIRGFGVLIRSSSNGLHHLLPRPAFQWTLKKSYSKHDQLCTPSLTVLSHKRAVHTSLSLRQSDRLSDKTTNDPKKSDEAEDKKLPHLPSFADAQPIHTNKRRITHDEVISAIENGQYETASLPLWMKLGFFVVPMFLFFGGYIIYNTSQGKPVFVPLWFGKSVPLEKATGIDLDLDKLKEATKEILLRKLSMNREIRLKFGLPLQLDDFQKFNVRIEYTNYTVEGIQIDCTKSWLRPDIKYTQREIVHLPSDFNGLLEPLKTDGSIDFDSIENQFHNSRDYNIVIEGRISVADNEYTKVDPGTGAITFIGVIEFDHTKTIKLIRVILSCKENGLSTIEKIW